MEIIKKENGNVELRDGGVLVWSMPQIPTEIRPIDKEERDHVKIFQADGRAEYLYVDEITETQIEPNAAVPFSGTVYDLADLMSSDFFFEVVSGGGGAFTYVKSLEQDFYFQRVLNVSGQTGDSFIAQPLNVFGDVTIEGATIEITSAGTGVALVGIYDLDGDGLVNNLLAVTSSEYDGTVTGLQTINFSSPLQLSSGSYATVFTRNNVGASPIFRVNNIPNPPFGVDGTSTFTRCTKVRSYDGTLPLTAPTGMIYLSGGVPRITFSLI